MTKQTVIIIPANKEERAGISTNVNKWMRRLEVLVEAGVAEEVESDVEGNREFEVDSKTIRMPVNRKPRVWTKAQKKAAQERLAEVRAAVKAAREKEAAKPTVNNNLTVQEWRAKVKADHEEEAAKAPKVSKASVKKAVEAIVPEPKKKFAAVAGKKKAAKVIEEEIEEEDVEEEDDDDLDDEDLDDDDEEEVVVKSKKK